MKHLLGLLAGFVIADGLLTYFLVRHGLAREGNPFLVHIVGESKFLDLKVVSANLCELILWDNPTIIMEIYCSAPMTLCKKQIKTAVPDRIHRVLSILSLPFQTPCDSGKCKLNLLARPTLAYTAFS